VSKARWLLVLLVVGALAVALKFVASEPAPVETVQESKPPDLQLVAFDPWAAAAIVVEDETGVRLRRAQGQLGGVIQMIVATVGLRLGVITAEIFTIIIVVAVLTSLIAPPLLRLAMTRIEATAEEEARLLTYGLRPSAAGDDMR